MHLPFRNHLKRGPKAGRSTAKTFVDLQKVINRDYLRDHRFLRRVIAYEDELLPWLLIQQEKEVLADAENHPWAKRAIELLLWRIANDLNEEAEIFWTPLADALMDTGAWTNDSTFGKAPIKAELLRDVRHWLEGFRTPEEIEQWLVFPSEFARKEAMERTWLSWKQIDRLTDDPQNVEFLSRNMRNYARYQSRLFKKGWEIYQNAPADEAGLKLRQAWLYLFLKLAGDADKEFRLPANIRQGLLQEVERPISSPPNGTHTRELCILAIALLAKDTGLNQSEFRRLMALEPNGVALEPMISCRWATFEDQTRLLEHQKDVSYGAWYAFLDRNPNLSPNWLIYILDTEPQPSMLLIEKIAKHPKANEDVWLKLIANHYRLWLGETLVEVPDAMTSAKVRSALREKNEDSDVLMRMLSYIRDPGEWSETFRKLVRLSPKHAAEILQNKKVPDAVCLSPVDIVPLLRAPEEGIRVAAICALHEISQNPVIEMREEGKSARVNTSRRA